MATKIARCHRIVWHYRAVLEPVWLTSRLERIKARREA